MWTTGLYPTCVDFDRLAGFFDLPADLRTGEAMITTYRIALSATTLLLLTCPAHAQQPSQGSASGGVVAVSVQSGRAPGHTMTIAMPAPFVNNRPITGAPYSAEEAFDHTQTLADGTHITQKTRRSKLFRDSEGRTRTERPMFLGMGSNSENVMIVEIADPVSGSRYIVDAYNHVAHRFAPPEKSAEPVRYPEVARAVPQGTTSAATRQAVSPPPAQANRPENVTESLGNQVIEGVMVEGKKTTTTFPIEMLGNDRPVVRVNEYWFSPELKITVLSKDSDPRMGESTMRLQNIDRSEPDPALFRVPPDYQIVDETGDRIEIKITRP